MYFGEEEAYDPRGGSDLKDADAEEEDEEEEEDREGGKEGCGREREEETGQKRNRGVANEVEIGGNKKRIDAKSSGTGVYICVCL